MPITRIAVTHAETSGTMTPQLGQVDRYNWATRAARYFEALAAGVKNASVAFSVAEASGVAASATATIVTAVATNKITINGVDFEGVASGATGNQWNVGSGGSADATSATNLAAAINGSVTARVTGVVTASAASNVVTITAVTKGLVGNCITLTRTGAPITVTGSGFLASGVDTVYTTHSFGA